MKQNTNWYNPANLNKKSSGINLTSLFTWVTVLVVIVLFWSGAAVAYQRDYIPHAIAKIEHKEKKFLATHKAPAKRKVTGIRSLV